MESLNPDEITKPSDPYLADRCGVCGHPWFGNQSNGGRDHPPPALWTITHGIPGTEDPDATPRTGIECFNTQPPGVLGPLGVILSDCARRQPETIAELGTVQAANTPGSRSRVSIKRYPSEVCPPGKTPEPFRPVVRPVIPTPSTNGFHHE